MLRRAGAAAITVDAAAALLPRALMICAAMLLAVAIF